MADRDFSQDLDDWETLDDTGVMLLGTSLNIYSL